MHLDIKNKDIIISNFGKNYKDSGSTEVQVAILSARIFNLQKHFIKHKKDYHGKYGLLKIISKRRKLLNYFKNKNLIKYNELIKKIGLRH